MIDHLIVVIAGEADYPSNGAFLAWSIVGALIWWAVAGAVVLRGRQLPVRRSVMAADVR
jgi:hypothetical protein